MQIIRSKRKSLALVIKQSGELIVRAPIRVSEEYIQNFIHTKKDWIEKNIQKALKRKKYTKKVYTYTEDEEYVFLDTLYTLHIDEHASSIHIDKDRLVFPKKFLSKPNVYMYAWYRKQLETIVTSIADIYVGKTDWAYTSIRIRNTKTRWGSCNHVNALHFNWRLIFAPMSVIEYVVIHELCHIPHKHHKKIFWDTVKILCPTYMTSKKWLTEHGSRLYSYEHMI